jgi:ABC-type branched-subunit amino acid transport system substrate-binding protein/LysM repeat protein
MIVNSAFAQAEVKTHVVGALDNYYSLSLKYDISIAELKAANPGIVNPKPGDVLVIPLRGKSADQSRSGNKAKPVVNKDHVYHVALLVPLYLEQVADTLWDDYLVPEKINELAPFRFIQFYHGFMMAADSLNKQGLKVKIYVYDVDQQSSKVSAVLQKPEMKKMDLIVGPFFKNSFSQVADFARENQIPVINPFSPRSDILEGNPFVFKLLPSVESQPEMVAKLVDRDFADHNVILYVANQFQHSDIIGKLKESVERADPAGLRKVTIVDYASDSIQGFKKYASLSKPNLVIIYAENEVLPAALLSRLTEMKDDYRISVIGLPEWERLTNIETIYLIALNAHIFMASYTDETSEAIKRFTCSYRARYSDEPLYYAFSGFDAGYFFLSALSDYGKDFENYLELVNLPLIQNQFRFVKKNEGGYDNSNWNVLQYFNYYLVKKSFY